MTKLISRNFTTPENISVRAEENGDRFIEGYAVLFNKKSKLIRDWDGEYYEIIAPQALDLVLQKKDLNVIATVDHDRSKMIGRTKSGTLVLTKDARGLKYTIKVPDTTVGNDIYKMIKRKDYFESSFIFTVREMDYDNGSKTPTRTILQIEDLYDVAVVVDGAYANTAVKTRSQEWGFEEKEDVSNYDILDKELHIIQIK